VDWGMISAVAAVVALVLTLVGLFIAWKSWKSMRDEARRAETAREEAERTAARLAIVSLVRRLDQHNILTVEESDLHGFYGSPGLMVKSAVSIRDELLKVGHALRKAQSELDEGYEDDIASLEVMGESCTKFLAVLAALNRRPELASGGDEFYSEVKVPHAEFRHVFETEIDCLAKRNGIQRRNSD
jgi:hypothetical protein